VIFFVSKILCPTKGASIKDDRLIRGLQKVDTCGQCGEGIKVLRASLATYNISAFAFIKIRINIARISKLGYHRFLLMFNYIIFSVRDL